MGRYRFDKFRNSSHMKIFEFIQSETKILDVGCATGYLGRKLIEEKNCELTGIEIDKQYALKAGKWYRRVYVANVESVTLDEPKGSFNYIFFVDVLEHTKNPEEILIRLKPYLNKRGKILICLPNIANIFPRLSLLFGRFKYTEKGILDKDHLRFYTKDTASRLIESAGLRVVKTIPIGKLIYYIRVMPTVLAYQFLFICDTA